MNIDKDTKIFFSLASNPGKLGAIFYNNAFKYLQINAIYKPLGIGNYFEDYSRFVESMIYVGASGFSVSMPFKKVAASYCVGRDRYVEEIGNANTIVKNGDNFFAYNTDWIGFERSCFNILQKSKFALIYGNGAVSDSIKYVLNKNNIFFDVVDRKNFFTFKVCKDYDFLINATPIGMSHVVDNIFEENLVKKFEFVFDVVVGGTNLKNIAKKMNKICIDSILMYIEQLYEQFKIYTGIPYPKEIVEKCLNEL